MTKQKAIQLLKQLPTMCLFEDAYGEPIDSDAYYEAVDMAIQALEEPKTTDSGFIDSEMSEIKMDRTNSDLISRQDAIKAICEVDDYGDGIAFEVLSHAARDVGLLPSAQPEIKIFPSIAEERYEDLLEYFSVCDDHGDFILHSRKEFKRWLDRIKWHVKECDILARQLESQPERKKGKWIDNGDRYFRCSLCGIKDTDKWHWCHGCGAMMEGEEDD